MKRFLILCLMAILSLPGLVITILPGSKWVTFAGLAILGWQFISDFNYACNLDAWPQQKIGKYYNNCTWYTMEGGIGKKYTTVRLWNNKSQYTSGHPPIATKTIRIALP